MASSKEVLLSREKPLNTRGNDFIERVTSRTLREYVAVRGEGGVAGEGKVGGVPKFHFWGKCTMPLNEYYAILYFASWGITKYCHNSLIPTLHFHTH